MQIIMHPHISFISGRRKSYSTILSQIYWDLWGFTWIAQAWTESARITGNQHESFQNHWESIRITKNHLRITEDHSRITKNHLKITSNHSRITTNHENHVIISENPLRISDKQLNQQELLRINKNHFDISWVSLENHLRVSMNYLRIVRVCSHQIDLNSAVCVAIHLVPPGPNLIPRGQKYYYRGALVCSPNHINLTSIK